MQLFGASPTRSPGERGNLRRSVLYAQEGDSASGRRPSAGRKSSAARCRSEGRRRGCRQGRHRSSLNDRGAVPKDAQKLQSQHRLVSRLSTEGTIRLSCRKRLFHCSTSVRINPPVSIRSPRRAFSLRVARSPGLTQKAGQYPADASRSPAPPAFSEEILMAYCHFRRDAT